MSDNSQQDLTPIPAETDRLWQSYRPAASQNRELEDLSPQELNLYNHHRANLYGNGKVEHSDGSISTLYQAVVKGPNIGGAPAYYNIPTVWDGKILPVEQATRRAAKEGWGSWPAYHSPKEADYSYEAAVHPIATRDVADYIRQKQDLPDAAQSDFTNYRYSGSSRVPGPPDTVERYDSAGDFNRRALAVRGGVQPGTYSGINPLDYGRYYQNPEHPELTPGMAETPTVYRPGGPGDRFHNEYEDRAPYGMQQFQQYKASADQEGRGSDTITGHLTPGDVVVPRQAQTPEVMGAIGSAFQQQNQDVSAYTAGSPSQNINPNTGYPEFQMPPYDDTEDTAVSGPSAPATPATPEPTTEAPVLTPSQIPAQPQPAIGATSLTGSVKPDEVGDQPSPAAMPPTTPMTREMQAPEEKPPGEPAPAPPVVFRGTPGSRSAIGEQAPFPIKQPRIPVPAETYKDLRSNDPALYDALNKVGTDVGVSPIDLAQLIKLSSDTDPSYKDEDGRVGYFAISPDEQKRIDPKQTLDINNPIQNLYMGALKWKEAEDEFGRGSKNAVAAFYAGPDVVKRMLQRPDASHEIALANAPGVWKFIDAFMGRKPEEEEPPPEGAVTSAGLPTVTGTPQEGGGIIGARADARELTVPPTVPYTVSPPPPVDQGGVRGPVSGPGGARDVVVPPTVPYTVSPPPPPDLGGVRGPVSGPGGARELVVPPTVVPPQAAPAVPPPLPGPPPVLQGQGRARAYPPGTVVNPETGEPEPPGGLQPTGTPAPEYGSLGRAIGRAIGNALPAITVQPEGLPGAQAAQAAAEGARNIQEGLVVPPTVIPPAKPVTTGSETTPQARTPAEATAPTAPPPTPPPGTPPAPRAAAGTPAEAVPPPPGGVPGPGTSVVPGAPAPAPAGPTNSLDNNSKPGTADPDAAMAATKAGGPVGLLSYVTYDAAPSNTTPSNGFAALRLAIYRKAALTDNWGAAGAAIELLTREQHAGSFDDLKRAYGAMGAKDWSAATYFLARSHAFVEDGAFIKFGVSDDKVYGQRYSEVTHQPMGGPFQVTQQNLMDNMRIVADPVKWAEMVDKEKKTNEEIVHNQMLEAQARQKLEFETAHANQTVQAEAQRVGVQQTEANRRAAEQHQISLYDAAQRVQANIETTNARLGAQQETQARAAAAADKEILEQGIFDPSSKNPLTNENGSTWDQEQLDRSKQIYKALRMNNTEQTVDQAKTLTKGLVSQTKESTPGNPVTTMKLAPLVDAQGRTTGFTVLDPSGHPRAYLSPQSLRGTAIPEVERALAANPPPTGPRQVPNIQMPQRPVVQPQAPVVFNPPAIGMPRRVTRDQLQAR
jgi:hypothetical protein